MPSYPLPDPEDPEWAEIMFELFPEARPPPPEDYFIIDLTRKGGGVRGYCQAEFPWKPANRFEIMPSMVRRLDVEVIDLTVDE